MFSTVGVWSEGAAQTNTPKMFAERRRRNYSQKQQEDREFLWMKYMESTYIHFSIYIPRYLLLKHTNDSSMNIFSPSSTLDSLHEKREKTEWIFMGKFRRMFRAAF